jgi:hypothetical protein
MYISETGANQEGQRLIAEGKAKRFTVQFAVRKDYQTGAVGGYILQTYS